MIKFLLTLLREWKEELWSIPLGLLLLFASPWMLRLVDPQAGTYDAGILQVIIFASVALLIFNGLAWMGIKNVFPEIFRFFQHEFSNTFNSLNSWQKLKLSVFLYSLLLLSLVLLSRVL